MTVTESVQRTGVPTKTRSALAPGVVTTKIAANLVLVLVGVLFLVPMLWMLFAAINKGAGVALAFPTHASFANFRAVLNFNTTYRPLLNGIYLCGGATLLAIVCAVLAAYPLSRFRMRFNRPFLLAILFSTGLPITAVMVPVYGLFVQLDLIDSIPGCMLFMTTASLPFAIWLMKNFMDGVSVELEEAAWVDGASGMKALWHVVLPLMWPGVSVVAIFTFIQLWGNFFVPFMLLLSPDLQPASVTIFTFFGQYGGVNYGQLAAFSCMYSLPVVALYIGLSRKLGGAFAFGGALKG
jgi:multiple sugar transport system permease protein